MAERAAPDLEGVGDVRQAADRRLPEMPEKASEPPHWSAILRWAIDSVVRSVWLT